MIEPTQKQLDSLPKWARRYIENLWLTVLNQEKRIEILESMMPWTGEGREWFTLFKPPHRPPHVVKIFLCSEDGTRLLTTIGENDWLFVGRGANQKDER